MFIELEDYDEIVDVVTEIVEDVYANTIIEDGFKEFELSYSEIVRKILSTDKKVKYYVDFDDTFDNIKILDEVKDEFFERFENAAVDAIESCKDECEYYHHLTTTYQHGFII